MMKFCVYKNIKEITSDFNTFNSVKPTKWLNIAKWSVFDLLSIVFSLSC